MDERTKKDYETQPDGPEQGANIWISESVHYGTRFRLIGFRVSPSWRWGMPLVLGGQFFDGKGGMR